MNKIKENNMEIQKSNQNQLRELEQFYTTNKIDNMLEKIEENKKDIVEEIIEYSKNHLKPIKYDEFGNPIQFKVELNPLVINNYFFKSITTLTSQEPIYNAEKLGMIFDYYCFVLAEVNDKIGDFPSSLTSFCKLAGITTQTLRNLRNSSDINMRIVVEKIYDQIGDENITMSQMGKVRERTTIFKLKSQNEMIEKQQPTVHINISEQPDLDKINERLNKYKQYANKKEK